MLNLGSLTAALAWADRCVSRRPLLTNLLLVIAVCSYAFSRNAETILFGLDGAYLHDYVRLQHLWRPWLFGLSFDPLQGLSDISFPLNTRLIPTYALQAALLDGAIEDVPTFVLFALELFWSSYFVFVVVLRASPRVALAACWVLIVFALPVIGWPILWPNFGLIPHLATMIAVQNLSLVALYLIGRRGWLASIGLAAAFAALWVYVLLAFPSLVVLMAMTACLSVGVLATARTRRELAAKVAAGIGALVVMILSGGMHTLVGGYLYSAAVALSGELTKFMSGYFWASILFHAENYTLLSPGLVVGGLAGAFLLCFRGERDAARMAGAHLVVTGLFLLLAVYFSVLAEWYKGAGFLYFEHFLWPFYAYYAVALVARVGPLLLSQGARFFKRPLPVQPTPTVLGLAALVVLGVWHISHSAPHFPYPDEPQATPITRLLSEKVALLPGNAFRGSVATFQPTPVTDKSVNWLDQHGYDYGQVTTLGNNHRIEGFWHFDIPTLIEYNQLLTPALHLVLSRTMARPQDWQTRNLIVLTVPDLDLLQALGTRFVVSDVELDAPAKQVMELPYVYSSEKKELRLYELPKSNLGTYSPVEVIEAADATSILRWLRSGPDFRSRVVLEAGSDVPANLSPATDGRLVYQPGRIHVTARSRGRSLLLLPVQFTECMRIVDGGAGGVRLLRANLVQTAVLFSKTLDIRLAIEHNPFGDRSCRLRDSAAGRRLKMREAAEAFPLVGPHVRY